jgi:K+-sensing histidine kinase KdpD
MAVGAAIRITSPDEVRIIEHAAAFAKQRDEACYVISVVPDAAYSYVNDRQAETVRRNVAAIAEQHAVPIVQEGDDVAKALIEVAPLFGIKTLFLQRGSARLLGRTIAERLLLLDPPFDVVVIGSDETT